MEAGECVIRLTFFWQLILLHLDVSAGYNCPSKGLEAAVGMPYFVISRESSLWHKLQGSLLVFTYMCTTHKHIRK